MKVSRIYIDGKAKESFAPQAEGHLNYLAGGFISGNDGQLGICNRFVFDTERMCYDKAKKATGLEKYGLLDYEDFGDVVSEDFFKNNHIEEFGVAFGKGLARCEDFKRYIAKFAGYFFGEGSGKDGSNHGTEEE